MPSLTNVEALFLNENEPVVPAPGPNVGWLRNLLSKYPYPYSILPSNNA